MTTKRAEHRISGEWPMYREFLRLIMSEQALDDHSGAGDTASRIVISYPADLSGWGRHQIDQRHFKAWLRKSLGTVSVGDAWEEFVGVGCCGSALDVPLQVERVDGPNRVGLETEIEYTVREACDIQGGWRVQSAGGPNAD